MKYFYPKEHLQKISSLLSLDHALYVYSFNTIIYSNYIEGLQFEKVENKLGKYLSGSYYNYFPFMPVDWTIDIIFSLENLSSSKTPFIYLDRILAIRIVNGSLQVAYNGRWGYTRFTSLTQENEKKFHFLRLEYSFNNYISIYLDSTFKKRSVRSRRIVDFRWNRKLSLFKAGSPIPIYYISIMPRLSFNSYEKQKSIFNEIFNIEIV